jgi:predicted transcriptional regulator
VLKEKLTTFGRELVKFRNFSNKKCRLFSTLKISIKTFERIANLKNNFRKNEILNLENLNQNNIINLGN